MTRRAKSMLAGFSAMGLIAGLVVLAAALAPGDEPPATTAGKDIPIRRIIESTGVSGGVVVHLGCGDGRLTAKMYLGDSYLVHGLDTSPEKIAKARACLQSQGLYGPVSVAQYDGRTLPYADNVVNLIVASGPCRVAREEIERVLVPGGVAVCLDPNGAVGDSYGKPRPENIDDWPQYLNKADNNAVARDSVAGPPRRLQWTDRPVWSRSHMTIPTVASVVTGKGRLFSIEDSAPTDNPFLPASFYIVARDAFNGKELWRRKMPRWESVTLYIKCQPVQQQRRMVAAGDVLYCTLEIEGPLYALDAATGKTLRVYENTSPTQEVAYSDGIVYLNIGDRFPSAAYNIVKLKGAPFVQGVDPSQPFYGGGFKEGYAPEIQDKPHPKIAIVALDPQSGRQLWAVRHIDTYTAASLAVKGDRAVYQAADGLYCVHAKTGERLWAVKKNIANAVGHDSHTPGTTPNTVIIGGEKVFAVEAASASQVASYPRGTLHAYSLADGKELWQAPITGNYESPADVFYVNGTVWIGGPNPTQLDPDSGEVLKVLRQQMTGPMGHDRCYRNLITERYFVNSKTGGADFLDLKTGREFPNHWTRGCCGMGVLPANGLVYSTPYSCQCSMGVMFQGMNAYASRSGLQRSDQPMVISRQPRLKKGPAYNQIAQPLPATDGDWPTYRHDGFRSGISQARVAGRLEVQWETRLPSRPSAVTSAAGKVFVSAVDAHTLYALDRRTGGIAWSFTADGRIDSPPTYYQGMVFFGSRDGWVYGLRASDGVLAWRFKDLPEGLIGAFGQLESKWQVPGSVLVEDGTLFFAAGRCSYLDGGIFLYALEPLTGRVLRSRCCYGPFSEGTGFPVGGSAGFKNDIMVSDGARLYLRHRAFDLELADTSAQPHIVPSGGFLDQRPQHRTCWALSSSIGKSSADILVSDGKVCYEVQGFPLFHNHSYFDPRRGGYTLLAKSFESRSQARARSPAAQQGRRRTSRPVRRGPAGKELWRRQIPITGKAIALSGDVLFVAGEPMKFDGPSYRNYVAAYTGQLGGRLLAVRASDGTQLDEYELQSAPVWDSLAVADGRLYLSLEDGSVVCLGPAD